MKAVHQVEDGRRHVEAPLGWSTRSISQGASFQGNGTSAHSLIPLFLVVVFWVVVRSARSLRQLPRRALWLHGWGPSPLAEIRPDMRPPKVLEHQQAEGTRRKGEPAWIGGATFRLGPAARRGGRPCPGRTRRRRRTLLPRTGSRRISAPISGSGNSSPPSRPPAARG